MNEKILIVDDDELVRSGLAVNIERAGFPVTTAADAEEARNAMEQDPAKLVLCDLVLGADNGMDVLRYIQANHPDTAVVIITGHGSVRSALDALKAGASDYIQKPADPDEVMHRIRMVLDSFSLRRTLMDERHRADERKRMIHDQLSRAERMSSLGALAEGAAHDLSKILRPVESVPDEIRQLLDVASTGHPRLIELGEALRKASAVIRDLETIGKSSNLKKKPLHLHELIEQTLTGREVQQLRKGNPLVKLEKVIEPGLASVFGSSGHLRQALENLIAHAMDSMSLGGMLKINAGMEQIDQDLGRFGPKKPGDYVVIRFEDSAARLSEEDLDRIFEPFYMRNRLGRHMLSGLGMTLVYRVVEDHDGFIDIRTDGPSGNVLSVYLPVAEGEDSAPAELRPDYTGRESVLLVDDSDAQRKGAASILQELGYEVATVANGHAAVDMVKARIAERPGHSPFDLLVIDLVLGDAFDGVETYKAIIELYPQQKAIMASGFADISRIVEARKLGLQICFQKPYTLETLGKHIRMALDN